MLTEWVEITTLIWFQTSSLSCIDGGIVGGTTGVVSPRKLPISSTMWAIGTNSGGCTVENSGQVEANFVFFEILYLWEITKGGGVGLSGLCDLYLRTETNFPRLRFLSIFDSSFEWRGDFLYRGYLGVSVRRVKLVSVVADLRKAGIVCFSVPVEYREGQSIGDAVALRIADEHASRNNCTLLAEADGEAEASPLYYLFRHSSAVDGEEKAGGAILVDRLDGHVWSYEEYEEYMYDYNNVM